MSHFYNINILLQDVVWFSKTKFDLMIAWEGAIALMFGYVIFKLARDKKKLLSRNKELVNKIMDVRTIDLIDVDSAKVVSKDNADKEFEKRLKELEDKYEANIRESKKLWEKREAELRLLYIEDAKAELEQWKNTELEQWKIKELDKVKRAAEDAHRKSELETLQHLRNMNRPKY
jgi:hypothetical protein